jgi:hypothetical protein
MKLTNEKVEEIIEYLFDFWENRILDWEYLRDYFELKCILETLATRLKQKGYHRCCEMCGGKQ